MITEDIDPDAVGLWLTGRVSASMQLDDGEVLKGPQSVGLDAAIEWGRAHSSRVTVLLDNKHYRAGTEQSAETTWSDAILPPRPRHSYESRDRYDGPWIVRLTMSSVYDLGDVEQRLMDAGFSPVVDQRDAAPFVVNCTVWPRGTAPVDEILADFVTTLPRDLSKFTSGSLYSVRVEGRAGASDSPA